MNNKNKTPKIIISVVPVDWEFKQLTIPDNGPAEEQIHEEGDGMEFFD